MAATEPGGDAALRGGLGRRLRLPVAALAYDREAGPAGPRGPGAQPGGPPLLLTRPVAPVMPRHETSNNNVTIERSSCKQAATSLMVT